MSIITIHHTKGCKVNRHLSVIIKKMGTSRLDFNHTGGEDKVIWELKNERIALSHRAFKNEVLVKLQEIVREIGGKLEI